MTRKPVWISHRGMSHHCDENTQNAFDLAVKNGFSHLETDLRISADGHIVLCHDRSLERVAGVSRLVDDIPREKLELVPLSRGGHLMFFDEFVERYAAYTWTFDIKAETADRVIDALRVWIKGHQATSWLEVQTRFLMWSDEHERRVQEMLPKARFYARKPECWRAGLAVIAGVPALGGLKPGRTYAVPPRLGSFELFQPRYVERIHRFGAQAIAFLPSSEAEARAALHAGFDEILTNDGIIS